MMHVMLHSGLWEMLVSQRCIHERAIDQVTKTLRLYSCNGIHSLGCLTCADLKEIVEAIEQISLIVGIPSSELKKRYGTFLLRNVVDATPDLKQYFTNSFDLLESLEKQTRSNLFSHTDGADLPLFECVKEPGRLTMMYRSPWPLADMVEGVIHGCISYFDEPIQVHKENFSSGRGENTLFVLSKTL